MFLDWKINNLDIEFKLCMDLIMHIMLYVFCLNKNKNICANLALFLTISVRPFKLCMMITFIKLYTFIPVSFCNQGHISGRQMKLKLVCFVVKHCLIEFKLVTDLDMVLKVML